jgi:pyruvate dehydrogenase E1 component alpha subunit
VSSFDDLYQEIVMDHYRAPRGAARLDHVPNSQAHENPTCGDSLKLEVVVGADGLIERVLFDGKGCAISTASASLMTEAVQGLTVAKARERASSFIKALRGDIPAETLDEMGDLAAFKGIASFPVRVKCATLAWHALLVSLPGALGGTMFERYDPREGRLLSLLDESGKLAAAREGLPLLSDEQALAAWRTMVLARQSDEWAVSLNRQGRMPTYVLNKGQEANSIGALMAVRKDDWFVPAFRELGGMLVRGVTLKQYYLYWYGNEWANHMPVDTYHMTPISVPVGSQMLHAVGLAWAERYRGTDRIAITFMGEGASSEGDFHEACNLAGVWKAGVIFYAQNNHWSISLPWSKQSASKTLAEKAFAYGFEGVRVDGNDIFAVYAAVTMAAERARAGGGSTLIEGLTYRLGAHTTSDDPTKYRSDAEVQEWASKDPLIRLERYLKKKKLITDEDATREREKALACAQASFDEVEQEPDEILEDTFQYLYDTTPPILAAQLERRKP